MLAKTALMPSVVPNSTQMLAGHDTGTCCVHLCGSRRCWHGALHQLHHFVPLKHLSAFAFRWVKRGVSEKAAEISSWEPLGIRMGVATSVLPPLSVMNVKIWQGFCKRWAGVWGKRQSRSTAGPWWWWDGGRTARAVCSRLLPVPVLLRTCVLAKGSREWRLGDWSKAEICCLLPFFSLLLGVIYRCWYKSPLLKPHWV